MITKYYTTAIKPANGGFGEYEAGAGGELFAYESDLISELWEAADGETLYELGADELPSEIEDIRGKIHNEPDRVFYSALTGYVGVSSKQFDLAAMYLGQIIEAIQSEQITPEEIAESTGWPLVEGAVVYRPSVWCATDGDGEVTYDGTDGPSVQSAKGAAETFVATGDWGDVSETAWIHVWAWQEGINDQGEIVRANEETHTIELGPTEPKCEQADHEWDNPLSIVGGSKENPGVWGHGGGVKIHEVCLHCGTERITDTWAQNPNNGEQGLTSVRYEQGKYAEDVA